MPPEWSQPLFESSAEDAQALYDAGVGGHTYPGSTVADLSDTTLTGINNLVSASNGWDTSSAYQPYYQSLASLSLSNPYISGISGSGDALTGVAGDAGNVYQSATAPTAASSYLTDYASGKYLQSGEGNPYYRELLDKNIADSNALVQSSFSGSGRYGSGANQSTIADNTSNMLLQGLNDDYDRMLQAQFDATGMIDAANSQSINDQLAALGLQGSTLATQGGLYGTAAGAYDTALGTAKGATDSMATLSQQAFENAMTGAQAQIDAGSILDTKAQDQVTDAVNQWYGIDNELWTQLGLLQSAAAGSAGTYGTGTSTSSAPVNYGSILSGLGSLFKSDRRCKEYIFLLGRMNGFQIYEFSYRGEEGRHIGVMAQEVANIVPEAILQAPDGTLYVNYSRLGFAPVRIH